MGLWEIYEHDKKVYILLKIIREIEALMCNNNNTIFKKREVY